MLNQQTNANIVIKRSTLVAVSKKTKPDKLPLRLAFKQEQLQRVIKSNRGINLRTVVT